MNRYARTMMDRAMRDGRNPYGSRGGYVRDRGMGNYTFGGYGEYDRADEDYARGRRDYDYADYRGRDYAEMDYRRRDYAPMMDYRDYRDYRDYDDDDKEMKLTRKDMEKWKREMVNEDGSHGEHFTKEQVEAVARQIGVNTSEFEEGVFCITTNMMYSDYCKVAKKYGVDRPEFYAEMAKAFLKDKDFDGKGDEKLALYYKCIVDND